MIYTRLGIPAQIVEAKEITIWVERRPGEIRHHDSKPKTKYPVEAIPMPFARLVYTGDSDDGSIKAGRPVCDDEFINVNELRADGGINEIRASWEEVRETLADANSS